MKKEITNILLVEDSIATVNYNKRLIQRNNISNNIQAAYNGEEAIEHILKVESSLFPNLILVDLNMPLLGGFGFLTKFENLFDTERRKNTMIVFLSTSILESDIQKSKEFTDPPLFIPKPLTKDKLDTIEKEYQQKFDTI